MNINHRAVCRIVGPAAALVAGMGFSVPATAQWSVISLHPAGAEQSQAFGVSGTQQVGWATVGGVQRASLWSGSAASWVDLHPAGATASISFGATGTQQSGRATFNATLRAGVWSGTAASWEDLSLALTGSWSHTAAESIWSDGSSVHVAGYGYTLAANRNEALLWVSGSPAPCPGDVDGNAVVDLGDLAILLAHFGAASGATLADGDLDGDGDVDLQDLTTLLANFGTTCP